MKLDLAEEATEFGRSASRAIEAAGGDTLVQQAEASPETRAGLVEKALSPLGAWDLDVRSSADELEAAAALCRSAGWWALAYPVAERLCRPSDGSSGATVVVGPRPAAAVAGLDLSLAAVDFAGRRYRASAGAVTGPARKTAFVVRLELGAQEEPSEADLALGLVLGSWTLLGFMDRALSLTRDYIRHREQFGQPLAAFQGVQFQLTDAEVDRLGVEELAKYALWSVETNRPEAVDDALAARLAAIEAADVVFRVAHQLHGAIGFCDETTLSWVSRYSAPLRRLPTGVSATRSALTTRVGRKGLTGLFGPS